MELKTSAVTFTILCLVHEYFVILYSTRKLASTKIYKIRCPQIKSFTSSNDGHS